MSARQPQECEHTSHSPLPTLSPHYKRQLAMLIANLIETHLSDQSTFDVECDSERADQLDPSTNTINVPIKEDYHAHHRSTLNEDQRQALAEDGLCLSASIEHGAGS